MTTFLPTPEWLLLDWNHACIAADTLCIQRCGDCGQWRHPPRRLCPSCYSAQSSYQAVSGRGSVYSFVVSHRSRDLGWQEQVPYTTLLVELEEGARVLAATSISPDRVSIGQQLNLRITSRSDDFVLLWADDAS